MLNQKEILLIRSSKKCSLSFKCRVFLFPNTRQFTLTSRLPKRWTTFFSSLSCHRHLGLILLVLSGCSTHPPRPPSSPPASLYQNWISKAANRYNVDAKLIHAIIQVESSFNPKAISPSRAIGLMQIKASSAGCDAYRYKGKSGCPKEKELLDPANNIDLGTAYLRTLQTQLNGIKNPLTRRYATTVAYANGAGALLRTFSPNRQTAIKMINRLSPEDFHWHIRQHHPAPQALRYMLKIEQAYNRL